MATVIVSIPIPPAVAAARKSGHGKHPKLVIRGLKSNTLVTVPYAPSNGDKAGVAPVYVRQPRPGRNDEVLRQFEPTPVLTLDLYFAHPDYFDDVEADAAKLDALADNDEPLILQGCSPQWAGPWFLTDLSWSYSELQPFTNRVTRATARVTFTFAPILLLPVGPVNGGVTTRHPKAPKKGHGKAKPKVYIVKRGDTLSSIAAKVLHNAKLWGRIASLNHIRRPYTIHPGQKLKLP